MEFSTNQGDVFKGPNRLHLNPDTMAHIIEQWLHVTTSGGPYQVQKIEEVKPDPGTGQGFANSQGFTVCFIPVPVMDKNAEPAKPEKQKRERKRRVVKTKPAEPVAAAVPIPPGFVPGDPVPEFDKLPDGSERFVPIPHP